ncbi:eIF2 kinase Gcn2p negative regulator [Nowakowskiella sp. JEL0078]|nr:eIF2 kinase Gcn2p negative regulator [Nowakowskiella sp. JEL0078]
MTGILNPELDDELQALSSIYSDSLTLNLEIPSCTLLLPLSIHPLFLSIQLHFPSTYPSLSPPIPLISLEPADHTNIAYLNLAADLQTRLPALTAELHDLWAESPRVVVFEWFEVLQGFVDSLIYEEEEVPEERGGVVDIAALESLKVDFKVYEDARHAGFGGFVSSREPLIDRKSVFVAHICVIDSVDSVLLALGDLKRDRKIARATHNISAYILADSSGRITRRDCDDDGETAAGKRLLQMLELMKVWNCLVVVTRWYGGINLGPKRFAHINNVARDLLEVNKDVWETHKPGKKSSKDRKK